MNESKCRSCEAPIYWIKMKSGKMNPVDKKKVVLVTEEGDTISGYQSHFSTCPQSKDWRKKEQ